MPSFETDKQLIERMLIPAMLNTIVSLMRQQGNQLAGTQLNEIVPVLARVSALFEAALEEPVLTQAPDRVAKLIRRAKRLTATALARNFERSLGHQYLILVFLTQDLAESEAITIGSDSPFAEGWELLADVMGDAWSELEKVENEARTAAAQIRAVLAAEGYFRSASLDQALDAEAGAGSV